MATSTSNGPDWRIVRGWKEAAKKLTPGPSLFESPGDLMILDWHTFRGWKEAAKHLPQGVSLFETPGSSPQHNWNNTKGWGKVVRSLPPGVSLFKSPTNPMKYGQLVSHNANTIPLKRSQNQKKRKANETEKMLAANGLGVLIGRQSGDELMVDRTQDENRVKLEEIDVKSEPDWA